MGTRGREIIGMDIEQLLKLLNQAYASEWLAYYQYWLGAKVIKGPMKDAVAGELLQHATEELAHADLVANRIIQLGGDPVLSPLGWAEKSPSSQTNDSQQNNVHQTILLHFKSPFFGSPCELPARVHFITLLPHRI